MSMSDKLLAHGDRLPNIDREQNPAAKPAQLSRDDLS
jgi:hypothetical protein